MLVLQNISYTHPNKDLLFGELNLAVNNHEKAALIGNNGAGKSTLLRIIASALQSTSGHVTANSIPYYVPQHFGQYDELTIAQALKIEAKLQAFHEILAGNLSEENYNVLEDDWTIEERCSEALNFWKLEDLNWSQKMGTLSGGQKTRVFLAGISIHQPELILMDEPSNHLDSSGRALLYDFIRTTKSTLLVVSHDRKLLNLLDSMYELGKHGIKAYGGNYEFYKEQKLIESNSLNQDIHSKERMLRKAKEKERETAERQQKLDSRGKKKQEKAGVSRIMMNTLRNNAENSTSRAKSMHAEKINGISQELHELRSSVADLDKMKFGFDHSSLHKGKELFQASGVNFSYGEFQIWEEDLSFRIVSGERIAIKGENGSGKTTLIKLILGEIEPEKGSLKRAECTSVYIDQDYLLIDNNKSIYEQALEFNHTALQEHEIKIRLNRFLFTKEDWDKSCGSLSGGEKMRLMLCCLTIGSNSPDILIFDEPTNNLDIQNMEILTAAITDYEGTLIMVSHDETFLEQVNCSRIIKL